MHGAGYTVLTTHPTNNMQRVDRITAGALSYTKHSSYLEKLLLKYIDLIDVFLVSRFLFGVSLIE